MLLSKWVLEAVNLFPVPMHYLFIGVIIGSIPALYQKANIRKFHPLYLLWASIGVAAMVGLAFIPEGLFAFESNEVSVGMFFLLLVAGLLVSIALILPGISVSHMLLILGIYEMIMDSISSFHIFPLIPLAIGTIIGILAVTHLLEKAMERFPAPTYLMIIGFVLASVVDLFPGIPSGINWLYCPLFFLLGVGISLFLLWMQKRKNTKKPKHYAKNKNKQ